MAILNNNNAISTTGGYDINNSLRFRNSASAYLSRTPASSGSQTTWTWSGWVKRGKLGAAQTFFGEYNANNDAGYSVIYFGSNDKLSFTGFYTVYLDTTQVFRDSSAWYHIVLAVDTTQATSTNRMKLYVNGVQVTAFSTANYPTLNATFSINNTGTHYLGFDGFGSGGYLDGYLAEVNFVNAQQLTPSSFGETDTTTGSWKPKAYSGSYGTNGFKLNFSDTSAATAAAIGKDSSGNGNNWTPSGISVTAGTTYDAMLDVPTNTSATVANYCMLNPLAAQSGTGTVAVTTSNANLTWNFQTSGASPVNKLTSATIGVSSGKWYWEITPTTISTGGILIGICADPHSPTNFWSTYGNSTEYMYISNNGNKGNNNVSAAYGSSYTVNDVIGVALDMDAGTLTFYKNNTSQGTAYTGLSGTYFPFLATGSSASTMVAQATFGQRPFTYTPPTGFVALNTFNLPTPTILQGNKYMDATLYTGTGSALTVTNAAGFKPDLVWGKPRSTASSNLLYDSVRGALYYLSSNSTAAEAGGTADTGVTAFNSNGFSLGSAAGYLNGSGATNVAWQWQAGQGSSSSNTNGSITSTVSVNTSAGFSVVTYTGTGANATVGHGLGVAPKMVIVKDRGTTDVWMVYHSSLGATQYIILNQTAAAGTLSTVWNNTAPTSSVFSVGTVADTNRNTFNFVAYCWAEIAGFSKFGSYTGNGSADGPFIFTNFQPKFIMIKRTDTAGYNWPMMDTTRDTYNVSGYTLYANLDNSEDNGAFLTDIVSNGFKLRNTLAGENASGGTYIYACFASNPFKNSNAR